MQKEQLHTDQPVENKRSRVYRQIVKDKLKTAGIHTASELINASIRVRRH